MKLEEVGSTGIEYKISIDCGVIWDICKDEDKFIKEFIITLIHEILHSGVENALIENYTLGEEKIVHIMNKERWTKNKEKFYKR